MKVPTLRPSTKSNVINIGSITYSAYESVEDSAKDLLLYMDEFNYPNDFVTLAMLINFMKSKGYFEQDATTYFLGVDAKLNSII